VPEVKDSRLQQLAAFQRSLLRPELSACSPTRWQPAPGLMLEWVALAVAHFAIE
jgi:hypothetical protein